MKDSFITYAKNKAYKMAFSGPEIRIPAPPPEPIRGMDEAGINSMLDEMVSAKFKAAVFEWDYNHKSYRFKRID